MADIVSIKIHPATGFARVGDHPTDYFIGPELPGDLTPPQGGYKVQCMLKRQAARFRLFGYDAGGNLVKEVTADDADITWTVHLANKKASANAFSGGGLRNASIADVGDRNKLNIDPGSKSLSNANGKASFTGVFTLRTNPGINPPNYKTSNTELGEIRTDNKNRLIVLGGKGSAGSPSGVPMSGGFADNDNWYDDVADGPVKATVKLKSNNAVIQAAGAWVIVTPPYYAPQVVNTITLWDKLFDLFVQANKLPKPSSTSFNKDIYPILSRGLASRWVEDVDPHHGTINNTGAYPIADAAMRGFIFGMMRKPGGGGGTMPKLNNGATITQTQYEHMQRWKDGVNYNNDWTGAPPPPDAQITPQGLDRAALEHACGAPFFPGIEAGAYLIEDLSRYIEPFRLDHAKVGAGDVTARMALPWQSDFSACGDEWWPPARPNSVYPQGSANYAAWMRGVANRDELVAKWPKLGFILPQGDGKMEEVGRCDIANINLLTPSLNFKDVPQGPGGAQRKLSLAVEFDVLSPASNVTLEIFTPPVSGQLALENAGPFVVAATGANPPTRLRIWVTYSTGALGSSTLDKVVFKQQGTQLTWEVKLTGNTVARKKAVVGLVLDRSGSMIEDRGDGQKKIDSLRQSASIFCDLMLQEDALALVRFNQDAQNIVPMSLLGDPLDANDPGRKAVKDAILSNQLNPGGSTSIGDGIFEARQELNAAAGYDVKAMVVLTDGMENTPKWLSDVAPQINEYTYSIGFGKPENISVKALQEISGNHGGYLLITGPIAADNSFKLSKYFLQILAGIVNASVILDPQGDLGAERQTAIPFSVTEADTAVEIILLCDQPKLLDFRIITPAGGVIHPGNAKAAGGAFVVSGGVMYYRLVLPAEPEPGRKQHEGTWKALLTLGKVSQSGLTHYEGSKNQEKIRLPYSLLVHSYSDLTLQADLVQNSHEPGAVIGVHAALLNAAAPYQLPAAVTAEYDGSNGRKGSISLHYEGDGRYSGTFTAVAAGVFAVRVRAAGVTPGGWSFTRETTLTAAVWHGGNKDVRNCGKPAIPPHCNEREENAGMRSAKKGKAKLKAKIKRKGR